MNDSPAKARAVQFTVFGRTVFIGWVKMSGQGWHFSAGVVRRERVKVDD